MKMSLEEATMKALLGQLDTPEEQKDDVEGIIDGVLVVTDPEITPNEYEEVIDNAKDIIEDTPEGEVPFNDQYVGEYLLTCPICGSSFINKDVLNVGDSCPICTEVPEQGFILNGQVATQEDVELQNDIKSEEEREENDDVNIGLSDEESIDEEPVSDEDVEEVQDELLASEVTRESDKKLEESKEDISDEYIKVELEKRYNEYCHENGDIDFQEWLDEFSDKEVEDIEDKYYNNLKESKTDKKDNYIKRPEQLNEEKKIKIEGTNKYISAEEKLEALYDDYKRQGMEKSYWTDLLNLIDDFDALDRWFDASYPEDEDDFDELEETKNLQVEDKSYTNIEEDILDAVENVCKDWNVDYKRYTNLEMNDAIKFKTKSGTFYVDVEELNEDSDDTWEDVDFE